MSEDSLARINRAKVNLTIGAYNEMRDAREKFEAALKDWAERVIRLNRAELSEYRKLEDGAAEERGDE